MHLFTLYKLRIWFGGYVSEYWFSNVNYIEQALRTSYHKLVKARDIHVLPNGNVYCGDYQIGTVTPMVNEQPPIGTRVQHDAEHL